MRRAAKELGFAGIKAMDAGKITIWPSGLY
jgi:hypothetical protein